MSKYYDITEVIDLIAKQTKKPRISQVLTWQTEYNITPYNKLYNHSDVLKLLNIALMKQALYEQQKQG